MSAPRGVVTRPDAGGAPCLWLYREDNDPAPVLLLARHTAPGAYDTLVRVLALHTGLLDMLEGEGVHPLVATVVEGMADDLDAALTGQ